MTLQDQFQEWLNSRQPRDTIIIVLKERKKCKRNNLKKLKKVIKDYAGLFYLGGMVIFNMLIIFLLNLIFG